MTHFKDKLVLIGLDVPNLSESFATPISETASDLTIKATVIDNIINDVITDPALGQSGFILMILLILGGACAFLLPQVSLTHRMIILGVAYIILVNVTYFLFSSFRIVPQTVYIALELLLFGIAAPFLDSKLMGSVQPTKKESAHRKVKAKAKAGHGEAVEGVDSQEVGVREIKASDNDPENQPTTAVATEKGKKIDDHQAIQLDMEDTPTKATHLARDDDDHSAKSDKKKQAGKKSKPEIVTPDDDQEEPVIVGANEPEEDEFDSGEIRPADIKSLGRYQVDGILGKGAMGTVYKGIDPAINRPVALKTIRLDFVTDPQEEAELKERLHREAQAAGKLSHPNIVTIYDVGSEDSLQYIAMEYLEGRTLEDLIKKKVKFNYRIMAQVVTQICNALDYAHEQGIIHRDIKPANIMILRDYRVKVMDYGIARVDSSSMTKTGIAMGTPNYISPEQLRGEKTDKRADIFSLGVVIYELLVGKRPFKGENLTSLIYSILHHEPEKPSNINPQIPLLFDRIVDLSLKKKPDERYQRAAEIASDLKDFVESFAMRA